MNICHCIQEQAPACHCLMFINKPSLYLQYKIHSCKNNKGKKNILLLFLPTNVSRKRSIYDATVLNNKRTSSSLE